MKIVVKQQRIMGAEDSAEYLNGEENFLRVVKAGWLKPLKGKQRGMDYDIRDLDAVVDRVKLEGWPPK